jgi:hypothetical protein
MADDGAPLRLELCQELEMPRQEILIAVCLQRATPRFARLRGYQAEFSTITLDLRRTKYCEKRKEGQTGEYPGPPKSSKDAFPLRYPAGEWRKHRLQQMPR